MIDHHQNELRVIGDYIQSLDAHDEMKFEKMIQQTNLFSHMIISENDDQQSWRDDDEEPNSLQYPVSLEGMQYYM